MKSFIQRQDDPRDMKVFRRPEGQPAVKPRWLKLRQGVADLKRRAQISQRANERDLDRLATPETTAPLNALVDPVIRHGPPVPRPERAGRR